MKAGANERLYSDVVGFVGLSQGLKGKCKGPSQA